VVPALVKAAKATTAASLAMLPINPSGDAANRSNGTSGFPFARFPHGADIWNASTLWEKVTLHHPAGVIANVYNGRVRWADVNYLSFEALYVLSLVAYPVLLVCLLLILTILVSICIAQDPEGARARAAHAAASSGEGFGGSVSEALSELGPHARCVFTGWAMLCRAIPALLVFGTPMALVALSYPYPQEVFVLLVVVSSVLVFSNGIYMVYHCPFTLLGLHRAIADRPGALLGPAERAEQDEVLHWVIFPNFDEDVEVMASALESVARCASARAQISVLLAMEEREHGSIDKAFRLQERFACRFRAVEATFHPPDLPNDPPGKASNLAWAFRWLVRHLNESQENIQRVVLTVSDADSDFHEFYFDGVARAYVDAGPSGQQDLTLWQSPVLHVKNYHRQPMPVVVGTMFTAMSEMALLSDPNAVRFPYSTYSLSLALARRVGGWDPEWIAEDWHMGIKCFLLTFGRSRVQPILLPTVNYTPEAETWLGTLGARWSQAKRHALGFSDMSYYFMLMPLIFARLSSKRFEESADLGDFWRVFFHGLVYIVRFVNTHVVIGIMTMYTMASWVLQRVMLQDIRHVGQLFDWSTLACKMFFGASALSMVVTTFTFQVAYYTVLQGRLEPVAGTASRWLFGQKPLHWAYCLVACSAFAPCYCTGLAFAALLAALRVFLFASFEYEVASKPTKSSHL